MKVALLWRGPRRRWHARLAERLAARGHAFVLRDATGEPMPTGLGWLLAAERRIYRAPAPLFEPVTDVPEGEAGPAPDLLIEVFFDGRRGDGALVGAVMKGSPAIEVRRISEGERDVLYRAVPAVEDPDVLARALEGVLVRLVEIIHLAVQAAETRSPHVEVSPTVPASSRSCAGFFARGLWRKLARRLGPSRGRPDHWRIAYRHTGEDGRPSAWSPLPDDGLRFQADPFAFEHGGRTHIFYEDYPYASAKGVIARVEVDAKGRTTPPRTVLEQPAHLSYPLVLEHDGLIYMLPEMSAARRIQLFRADPFPDRWVADRVLVDDVVASDATLILHAGRYWIFATLSDDGGSSWDRLGLFHAPDLLGPWTAHAMNPVLIDAGAARPAGAMWQDRGTLMRVAQDCRSGYGVGLAICRVDQLDLEGFRQTVVERRAAPPESGAIGIHSSNKAGTLEVIDLKRSHVRSWPQPFCRPGNSSRTGA